MCPVRLSTSSPDSGTDDLRGELFEFMRNDALDARNFFEFTPRDPHRFQRNQFALEILPDSFASDPDRLARFQREAQVLASLNHPHIAAILSFSPRAGQRFHESTTRDLKHRLPSLT